MKELRELIQSQLNGISNVDSGVPIPDDIVEIGKTYFGYELQEDNIGSDMENNYTMQVNITGRIVRKDNPNENTLEIIDNALAEIKKKLKGLNFKYSYKDITLDNGIRKILVTGNAKYNEINKKLII
jgi:hypothetical protein